MTRNTKRNTYHVVICSLLVGLISVVFGFSSNSNLAQNEVLDIKKIRKKLGTPDVSKIYGKDKAPSAGVIELGKMLFFDPRTSKNQNTSCVSCHSFDCGLGDGLVLSQGTHGNTLNRHSPSLYNLAWKKTYCSHQQRPEKSSQ